LTSKEFKDFPVAIADVWQREIAYQLALMNEARAAPERIVTMATPTQARLLNALKALAKPINPDAEPGMRWERLIVEAKAAIADLDPLRPENPVNAIAKY